MFEKMTTVTQGCVGLGIAIAWFVENHYVVSVPLNDNQPYDIIVDDGNGLKRVQVKTTRYKQKGGTHYTAHLSSIRSNKTCNKIKKFDANTCDLLFVVTELKDKYLIPSKEINGLGTFSLGPKATKWKVI